MIGLAGTVGGVVGVGVKGLWDRFWRNKDATRERTQSLSETARNELKQAYADLLGACGQESQLARLVRTSHASVASSKAKYLTAQMQAMYGKEQAEHARQLGGFVEEELLESLENVKKYLAHVAEVQTLAMRVLLLEHDHEFIDLVTVLYDAPISVPPRTGSADEFNHDVETKIAHVDRLIAKLSGRFAPTRWHSPEKPKAKSKPALPAAPVQPALPAAPVQPTLSASPEQPTDD